MEKKYILGLDIGGTKVECALFANKPDRSLEKIVSQRIETLRDNGYKDVLKRISELALGLLKSEQISIEEILGLGSGLPGSIDPFTKKMINGNSAIFIEEDFIADLSKLTGLSNIQVANDANLFALAETLEGAGRKYCQESSVPADQVVGVGIILGTGCGGGLCLKGNVYTGVHGGGAEIGHSVLVSQGRDCYCGRKGCAEQYLSGSSVERMFKERCSTDEPFKASEIFNFQSNENVSNELQAIGQELLSEYRENLSEFLTNLTALFDPHFFVLGGGVSTIDAIYEGLEEKLWQRLFVKGSRPRVFRHQIGDSAGALGAALLISQSIK
jgi:predicted NBD/HSP70 family sugar kinase